MASFTDNLQYLTDYKPYVAQQDVQLMGQIGQQKQQKYEQGVQRIQESIDKIAGLDVVRPVDREYLQSKLNGLHKDLRFAAAGDFSNFQLVNSVGGMINSIAKDSNIQNAVASTAKYRKGVSDKDTAIKEGKSAASNEWDFNNQVQSWLTNPDVKSSFSGSYQPYTNYKKNALELIKSVTKDSSIKDDAFTFDNKGNLVISDAIVRKKFAGISPEKIQEALMAGLTPSDFRQMEIDGRYNYSNLDPGQLQNRLNSSYSSTLSGYNEQKRVLENSLSSTTSIPIQNNIKEQIRNLDKTIGNISKEQSTLNNMILSGNADSVKAHLHTNEFMNNFSKAFSYTETSETYEDSPFVKNAHWKADMEWDKLKFRIQNSQKERELGLKAEENAIKRGELEPRFGGLGTPIDQKLLPNVSFQNIFEDTENREKALKSSDLAFANTPAFGGKGQEWLNQQIEANAKGSPIDPDVKIYLDNTEALRKDIASKKSMLLASRNEAAKSLGITNVDDYMNSLIPANSNNVYFEEGNKSFNYSPRDFVDFNTINNRYISHIQSNVLSAGTGGGGKTVYDLEKAKKELSPKMYNLLEIQSKKNPTEGEKQLIDQWQYYNEKVNLPAAKTLNEIDKLTQENLKNRITVQQGVDYELPSQKEELRKQNAGMLAQFIDFAEKQKGGIAGSPNFNIDDAKKLMADSNTKYLFNLNEGSSFSIGKNNQPIQSPSYTVIAMNDQTSVTFNVTPEQKKQVFGSMFESSPEEQQVKPYIDQIRTMGGITTAYDGGETNHNNAYLTKNNFTNPNLKYYGLNGNLVKVGEDRYRLRLNVYDPVKKEWIDNIPYPASAGMSKKALYEAMRGIDTNVIYSILNGENISAQDEQELKKEYEKPL